MKLSDNDLNSLRGKFFTSSYTFKPKPDDLDRRYLTRREILTDLCRQKQIIHLGCVDHNIDMIKKKIEKGKWLHKDLVEHASRCVGIDLNKEGLEYLKNDLGMDDLICENIIEKDCETILSQNWDYFLIPEVLEHQDNPVSFLSEIKNKYGQNVDKFIVTVPNAFDLGQQSSLKKNQELINNDHRYWFTPYTLSKVLIQAGFNSITLRLCRNGIIKKRAIMKNFYLAKHPFYRNNITAIAS